VDPTTELRARLGDVPLFARAPAPDLAVIAQRCGIREIDEGAALLGAGEIGDEFFVVLDGKVEVRRDGAPLAQLGSGDHFGELALLDPAPRNADVVAVSPAVVGVLDKARFRLVLDAVPGVSEAMLAFLARRLREESSPNEPAGV
jgi:CRP-like cAMP-binding protein